MDKWIRKMWYRPMVKSYSVIKTEIMSLAAIWKELEVIVQ
jgi:hypothetical protein